jgi:hypothetical protein
MSKTALTSREIIGRIADASGICDGYIRVLVAPDAANEAPFAMTPGSVTLTFFYDTVHIDDTATSSPPGDTMDMGPVRRNSSANVVVFYDQYMSLQLGLRGRDTFLFAWRTVLYDMSVRESSAGTPRDN